MTAITQLHEGLDRLSQVDGELYGFMAGLRVVGLDGIAQKLEFISLDLAETIAILHNAKKAWGDEIVEEIKAGERAQAEFIKSLLEQRK